MGAVTILKKSKWLVLCGLAMTSAVVFMDSTILPIALPTIQKAFPLSSLGVQWAINAYLLVLACLVLVGGKLADFFGHRKMLCIGMGTFGVCSILGGFAYCQTVLIVIRAFQGLSGALMLPASMALLAHIFPENERGKAIGLLVAIGSIFLSVGPVVGGFITEYLSWRWVFWINVPLIVTGIYIIRISLPKSERAQETFDVRGCVVFIATLVSLILALMQGREWGWRSSWVLLLFTLSVIFAVLLIYLLRRSSHPFIDYRLFKNKAFMGSNLLVSCVQFLMTVSVYWAIYFQTAWGYTPVEAGVLVLVSTLPVIFGAPFSGYLADRWRPCIPVLAGFICTFFAFLIGMTKGTHVEFLVGALFLFGLGISLIMTPIGTMILFSVPAHKKGVGLGIYSTVRHTMAPLSVAILGSIISNISFFVFKEQGALNPVLRGVDLDHCITLLARGKPLSTSVDPEILVVLNQLFTESSYVAFFWAHLVCASVSLLGLVFCFIYFWDPKPRVSQL